MTSDDIDQWLSFAEEPSDKPRFTWGLPEAISAAVAVVVLIGVVLLWPSGAAGQNASDQLGGLGIPNELHEAVVIEQTTYACGGTAELDCALVIFELSAGPDAGRTYTQEFPLVDTTPTFTIGQRVVLSRVGPNGRIVGISETPCDFDASVSCTMLTLHVLDDEAAASTIDFLLFPGQEEGLTAGADVHILFESDGSIVGVSESTIQSMYQYADSQRRTFLWVLMFAFAAAVIALGRWRGVAALTGLALSLIVVVVWLIPSLLDGNPPAWVALIGAAAVAYVALYVSHGFSRTSTIALLGTVGALALTTVLSVVTVSLGSFTGFVSEESTLLILLEGIDIRGLLLAGMVIGAAGALDDVTVTQASAIAQIRRADPSLSTVELFARGMTIGKAHVGSIVNTLMLAYLGAALPLTILFVASQQSLGTVSNSEVVAVEIVRTIVGTLGIIAAVPLTTWLATLWPSSDRHVH